MHFFISWLDLIVKLVLLWVYCAGLYLNWPRISSHIHLLPLFSMAALPFFILYKLAIAFGRGTILNGLYTVIALSVCIVFTTLAICNSSSPKQAIYSGATTLKQHRIFSCLLAGIFIFFCLRGLYLEYPGDAVIYLQRIGLANQDAPVNIRSLWNYSAVDTFFSSFQQWLVGNDYLMRSKLRFIAALSACLLCLATYRLALWCTRNKTRSMLAVLLFLGFYGNLQISFFLYKILQGATFAMVVYLEAIPILYELLSTARFRNLLTLPKIVQLSAIALAIWMCVDCHKEKTLYFFAISFSYTFFVMLKTAFQRKCASGLIITLFLAISVFLIALCFSGIAPHSGYSPLITPWFAIGNQTLSTYWPAAPNSSLILLDFMVLGLAILLLTSSHANSKEFFMGAIASAPIFIFVNPIAITGLLTLTSPNNLYRIVIGGLPWIFLPLACRIFQQETAIKMSYLPILLVLLGGLSYAPFYGKLPHLLNRVPSYADGSDLAPVIEHLLAASDEAQGNQLFNVLAPPYVSSYLAVWPRFLLSSSRWLNNDAEANGPNIAYVYGQEITQAEIAGTVPYATFDAIVMDRRDDLKYQSWLGQQTQHWAPNLIASQQAFLAGWPLQNYLENQPQAFFEKTLEENGFQVYQKIAPEVQ